MPPLSSYTWMTLNCAQLPRIHFGPQDHLQLNPCVLVQWHFVRDHILVIQIQPHQLQCLHGKICHLPQVIRIYVLTSTWWLEKCSTLIGSGTAAWALILGPRGLDCHSLPDRQTECRILPF